MTGNTYLVGFDCYQEYGSKIGKIIGQSDTFLEIKGDGSPEQHLFIFSNAIKRIIISKEDGMTKVYIYDT